MWKALIKWVESWSYRCDHEWDNGNVNSAYQFPTDKHPYERRVTYICKKCKESKKVTL